MNRLEVALVVLILCLGAAILSTGFDTWNDRAARRCQQMYGTYTSHPVGEHYCVLSDGTIKGLR